MMIELSSKWAPDLISQGETGMGYQIVSVELENGMHYDQVVVIGGTISQIKGVNGIPFCEDQIVKIIVTHDKWDFNNSSKT